MTNKMIEEALIQIREDILGDHLDAIKKQTGDVDKDSTEYKLIGKMTYYVYLINTLMLKVTGVLPETTRIKPYPK